MKWFLPDWSTITVAGADAGAFLQNLCTNDVKALGVGDACEAFFTDVKGRVLAAAIVCRSDAGFHVVVTSPRAAELSEHLDRYHIREDVRLTLEDEHTCQLEFGETPPDDVSQAGWSFPVPALGADARMVLGDFAALATRRVHDGVEELSPEAFEQLRVEHALPLDHVDVNEKNLPQEVNRDDLAINFTKGCYLGQETVARIDALGHVNRRLLSLKLDGADPPPPGAPLRAGDKEVGVVTSACRSQRAGAPLALAYVRRGHDEAGGQLQSDYGTATILPGAAATE